MYDEGGSGYRRSRGIHGTAARVFASADASAWMALGDSYPNEAITGRGSWGRSCGRGHGTAGGDVAFANKAPQTSAGGESRRCGRGHEMAAGIIASTAKSARTSLGGVATDEGRGGRARFAGADEATERPWGSSPPQMSPRGRPWGCRLG